MITLESSVRRFFLHPVLFAAVLLTLYFAPASFAQSASRQLGPLSKRLSRITIEKLAAITNMTDDQREQVMVLYDGYASGHKQLLLDGDDAAKVLSEEFQESHDWQKFATKQRDNLFKLFEDVRKKRADFLADFQSLLTAQQSKHWDDCERYMRRDDTARIGFMAGSMVDVVALCEQSRIPREGDVAAVLDQYEVAFDPISKQWLTKLDEFFKKVKAFDPTEEPDESAMFTMLKEIMELSLKVRNTNRSYAKQLKDVLPDEQRGAFDAAYLSKSYPLVYEKRYVAQLFDKASSLNVLSAQQTTELASLRESYERDLSLVNAEWAKQIDERQEKLSTDPEQFRRSWDDGETLIAARKARKDLDDRTAGRIESLLDESLFQDASKDLKRDADIHNQDILPDFDELTKEEDVE